MKHILQKLFGHETLSRNEAREILIRLAQGEYDDHQIAAFLCVFQMRTIALDELQGFRDALMELRMAIDLSEYDAVDLCGTGGDGKNTFNISTLASFVVAGAGVRVAKHGNYGVSSGCGSSNVMEHLGYRFTAEHEALYRQLEDCGLCFLHAPLFHPAMKRVGPIRRSLQVKTFFNMLGPMVNPGNPDKQLVGVFSNELARMYHYIYQQLGKQFCIIHALDGYDEVSLTGPFKYITPNGEELLTPGDIGMPCCRPEDLFGGNSVNEAARIFMDVLENRGSDIQANVVIANAGLAIACARDISPAQGMEEARESLSSGAALGVLQQLLQLSKQQVHEHIG